MSQSVCSPSDVTTTPIGSTSVLVPTRSAHVFRKLELPGNAAGNRRVLAMTTFLQQQ